MLSFSQSFKAPSNSKKPQSLSRNCHGIHFPQFQSEILPKSASRFDKKQETTVFIWDW